MKRVLTFCSGNKGKIAEVNAILSEHYEIKHVDIDLDEYQGTPDYVAERKCQQAAKLLNGPVLVEDTSLCFNAMNGLPGVYIKWFLKGVGREGLYKMLDGFEDKTAYAQCIFAYTSGVDQPVSLYKGICDGSIVQPRGPPDFGWDPVFEPKGFNQTFAEMDSKVKNTISHRAKALDVLKSSLLI
ncbi:unnamed protein product [Auanema sp. JU1783]|nr:unnamed protein product [Auanema sp. JU1783]